MRVTVWTQHGPRSRYHELSKATVEDDDGKLYITNQATGTVTEIYDHGEWIEYKVEAGYP